MAKKKLVPDYKIDLSKDATTNGGTIANIYDSIKDSEKSFYSQLTRLKSKSENNSITLADVARAFIRKDVDDSVAGELSFSKSIKSDNYSQGDLGSGWKMSKDEFGRGTLDIDNINVRNELITKILTYDKIQSAGGTIILSAAWAELTRVEEVNENTINHKIICYYIPEGNLGQMWREKDIIKLQSGANKYLMSNVESISNTPDAETGEYSFIIYHGGITNQIGESIPAVGDTLVQFGCLDDNLPERQNIIIMSVGNAANTFPYIEQYAQVNSFELSGKLITRISDEVYFGAGDQSKYLWWNQNGDGEFLLKGTLNQSPSGDKTPPPVWRGNYSSVTLYYAGDLVMYNGNTYIAKQNSTNKIGDVLYWTLYTSAGTGVESVTQQFHISTSKTVQPVEGSVGWVNVQPTWSVGSYLWNRIKIVYKDPPSTVYTGYSVSTEWEAINSIEIGGRNILNQTKTLTTTSSSGSYTSASRETIEGFVETKITAQQSGYTEALGFQRMWVHSLLTDGSIVSKEKYVLSFDYKTNHDSTKNCKVLAAVDYPTMPISKYLTGTSGEWKRGFIYLSWELTAPLTQKSLLIQFHPNNTLNDFIVIRKLKLEKGNMASDWSPSTKDVQDNIENARQTELNAINDYISSLGEDIEELQDQIDNVVVSWFGEHKPSESTEPQLSWLDYPTDEEKIQEQLNHINDTFTNTTEFIDITATPDAGKSWRFVKDNSVPPLFKWSRIQDSESAEALLKAYEALDVADKKRQVFLAQPTYAQSYDEGDIWLNATASGGGFTYVNEMLRCKTEKPANYAFSLSHWVTATKYTDDTLAQTAFGNAEAAATAAGIANDKLTQWASDGYIDPSEKQSVKAVWDEIQIEKPKIITQAAIYDVDTDDYTSAYQDVLYNYVVTQGLLANMTIASTIVRQDFEYAFSNYYLHRQNLLNAIAEAAKIFVGTSINDIKIGGRNLILKSDFSNSLDGITAFIGTSKVLDAGDRCVLTNASGSPRAHFENLSLEGNTQYIFQVERWWNDIEQIAWRGTNYEYVSFTEIKRENISFEGGVRVFYKITLAGDDTGYIQVENTTALFNEMRLRHPQLERGTLATDWAPAIEDSIGLISATKTVRYSKWKAGNYYFAGNVDDGGVGNNPLRYLDYVTNNRTDSAIGAYECKSYHLADIYNEPKTGTPPPEWQNTTYFPTIAGDIALFNQAVLGGFAFSPSYDSYGNLIPASSQILRTTDSPTTPATRLAGDGSGHFAKGKISFTNDEFEIEYTNNVPVYSQSGGSSGESQTIKLSSSENMISLRSPTSDVEFTSQGVYANKAGVQALPYGTGLEIKASIVGLGLGNLAKTAYGSKGVLCGVFGDSSNSNDTPADSWGGYFKKLKAAGFYANVKRVNDDYAIYTLTGNDYLVSCYNGTSNITINLPPSPQEGQQIIIKLISNKKATINGNGKSIFRTSVLSSITLNDSGGDQGRACTFIWDGNYWNMLLNSL